MMRTRAKMRIAAGCCAWRENVPEYIFVCTSGRRLSVAGYIFFIKKSVERPCS